MEEKEWTPIVLPDYGPCPQCGEHIELARRSQYVNVRYCSSRCAEIADKQRRQERRDKRKQEIWNGLKEEEVDLMILAGAKCRGCGKPMPRERLLQNTRQKCCSEECRVAYWKRYNHERYMEGAEERAHKAQRKRDRAERKAAKLELLNRDKELQAKGEGRVG